MFFVERQGRERAGAGVGAGERGCRAYRLAAFELGIVLTRAERDLGVGEPEKGKGKRDHDRRCCTLYTNKKGCVSYIVSQSVGFYL